MPFKGGNKFFFSLNYKKITLLTCILKIFCSLCHKKYGYHYTSYYIVFSSFVVCSLCLAACKGQDIIGYSREVVDQILTKMMAMSQMFI